MVFLTNFIKIGQYLSLIFLKKYITFTSNVSVQIKITIMQIAHKIDDFLFIMFPDVKKGDNDKLIKKLEEYYSYGPFKPLVKIENDWIFINIDTPAILTQESDYRKVISYCEKGKYSEAKPILSTLIEKNPSNSEYHRIFGQILSDQGDQEEAINSLIDALRWDPRNGYALIMMGNIYAKFKNDVNTAMIYYDQAVKNNPNDHIALNNIGANLMHQNKLIEAKIYFDEALRINSDYANTHYGLAMIAAMEKDYSSAFYSSVQSLKKSNRHDQLYTLSFEIAFSVAKELIKRNNGKNILDNYLKKLEFETEKNIQQIEDASINTSAKIEIAENYKRVEHIIKYNPKYPANEHLQMHELVHLDFITQARKEGNNKLFVSNSKHKSVFIKSINETIHKLNKAGLTDESLTSYIDGLYSGINLQAFNTPIDLFIENYLYNEFSDLRPYQFLSLFGMISEGVKSVTDKRYAELSPKKILTVSKIYNLVNALQFKELFGIDLINELKATAFELKQAQGFFDEFLEYRPDREPGEEYELVQHWAEDLKLNTYFELIDEETFHKNNNSTDSIIEKLEKDPLGLKDDIHFKENEMKKFQDSQKDIGLNMAVVMFMVDALQFFSKLSNDKIKEIAMEIALLGTQGYSPEKKDYMLHHIPGKKFSGYHILAYYYVSWSLAIPEMLQDLKLPYDKEYEQALNLYKNDKK
jgi:Tfp pilus assembly protein PilF